MQGADHYKQIQQEDEISLFVMQHADLVKRIARHLKSRLPIHIDLDDLIQSGLVGLLEARLRFSTEHNTSFETFASLRIRGAMIDGFRKNSGMTREISSHIKTISSARARLENNLNRDNIRISHQDLADEIGVPIEKFQAMLDEINSHQSIHSDGASNLDDFVSEYNKNPLDELEWSDKIAALKTMINDLGRREQLILALYYNEQLTFKEIADLVELTEARVSQIHSTLLVKIKQKWINFVM